MEVRYGKKEKATCYSGCGSGSCPCGSANHQTTARNHLKTG